MSGKPSRVRTRPDWCRCRCQLPIRLPPISNPTGRANATMTSAIAKQRSAGLHFFQSEIKSRIYQPPAASNSSITDRRGQNSAELCLCRDKQTVNLPGTLSTTLGENRCPTESRGHQPDESSHPTDPVRYPAAAPGRLPLGRSLSAGVAIAGGGAAIPAVIIPIIPVISRPRGCPAIGAAGIWGPCGRRAVRPTAAAIRGGPAAPAGARNGMDAGLLELGRALGVGARALCRPPLCPCRVGAR